MVFNTLSVATAVTPSVIETYFSHYLNRGPLRQKPTAHISYHEGLRLIREFLEYSSKHTVEDLQNFTSQWVPCPSWVRINDAEIAPKFLDRAAELLRKQLGPRGLELVGGVTWWQWRRNGGELRAEWIEMKKEYHERKHTGAPCERVILYVHGGAYYFGSVDEHRYQMQRHARKLKARVLSPRYRLAPQFPFPCGLYDCLATYFYLLEHFYPSQILFAGDSAGAGMVLSMLVILRDQEQPLPAGTILLSPWVDLTHSFPSVAGNGSGDYIPSQGFHHRPSMAWPPSTQDVKRSWKASRTGGEGPVELPATAGLDMDRRRRKRRSLYEDDESVGSETTMNAQTTNLSPMQSLSEFGTTLKVDVDGKMVELGEQIQLYTTNELLAHPLVSPIMQPSLGGLPPMLIQTGGAELLRDEQIFLAHKAANPAAYPPNDKIMRAFDPERKALERWPPTNVQVQLWEDLCHVPQTLSFTRPAKYMYRSIAQFGAWALARAQQRAIAIPNDDALSIISSGEEEENDEAKLPLERSESSLKRKRSHEMLKATKTAVRRAGDPLPPFKNNMIRQRVTRHGVIYPMAPPSELACLALDPAEIGVPKAGPVRKWLAAREAHDTRFASERKKVEKKRAKEAALGYDAILGENPPPSALVNRRRGGIAPEEKKKGRSWGLAMWSGWGSNHDEQTLQRELKSEKRKGSLEQSSEGQRVRPGSADANYVFAQTEEKEARRSSVGARLPIPWSSSPMTAQGIFTRSAHEVSYHERVVDAGQISQEHHQHENARETAVPDGTTNSQSASRLRPMSSSFSSPIPVENDASHRRHESRNARDAPIAVIPEVPAVSTVEERTSEGNSHYDNSLSNEQQNMSQTAISRTESPAWQEPVELETPHLELAGDPFDAVELSAVAERDDDDTTGDETSSRVQGSESNVSASASSDTTPEQRSASTFEALKREDEVEIVSPVDPTLSMLMDDVLISPIDEPAQQKWPFKLRNQVFDHRTSMLGSIGADGMPNAHYAFLPRSATATPELRSSDENKPPFKLRSTIYVPDAMLDKTSGNSQVSENAASRSITPTASSHLRESGALGMSLNGQIIIGDQSDSPDSYVDRPATNTIMPELTTKRPLVKENVANEDSVAEDKPPIPPPKDEKPLPTKGKVTGLRKPIQTVNSVESLRSSTPRQRFSSVAPAIGDLTFERPQLDSFVTASEGKDLQTT